MKISFLIVTKNRDRDLVLTLSKLKVLIDLSIHEVLVFIDGCSETETLIKKFDWVNWTVLKKSISASPARNILYKKAKGSVFIGLDDDAHPISENFIDTIENEFSEANNIGIVAFQEVRGIFKNDKKALLQAKKGKSHLTNDFVGCGFAMTKKVYDATNGFPVWIDIYGEEPALALEVMDLGYDIKYNNNIIVNHRVDSEKRKQQGRNYYRFERQLKNEIRYYLVYYPKPIKSVLKVLFHNFKKYALSNFIYFKLFVKVCFSTLFNITRILKHRKPVKYKTLERKQTLVNLKYK